MNLKSSYDQAKMLFSHDFIDIVNLGMAESTLIIGQQIC